MKYGNVNIKEFHVEFDSIREQMGEWLKREDIEIVEILTTSASSSRHGFSYVIYSIIYREI